MSYIPLLYNYMITATPTAIYDKLAKLEAELQRLKLDAYFSLPKESRPKSLYDEKEIEEIIEAVRETREDIWQKRYAKKIARLS